jgi:hypothetical protein
MYAHRIIQPLNGLHLQLDLPPEFAGCQEAEIIVLPIQNIFPDSMSWEQRVLSLAGTLSDDFPDDIDDSDLGEDVPRESLE